MRTDKHDEANSLFRQLANATKKCINFSKIESKSKPSR